MKPIFSVLMTVVFLASQLAAGVVVDMKSRDLNSNKEWDSKIFAQGERLRLDTQEPGEGSVSIIFQGDAMLILDHDDQTYVRMDEESMQQIQGMMKQMEEQMKNLPPQQREMVESMMKDRMPGLMGEPMTPAEIEAGGSAEFAGRSCTMYTVRRDNELIRELCAAQPSELGEASEVVDAFQAMAAYMKNLVDTVPQMAQMTDTMFAELAEIDGFPVMTREFENGQPTEETVMHGARSQQLGGNVFEAPSNYRQQKLFQQ